MAPEDRKRVVLDQTEGGWDGVWWDKPLASIAESMVATAQKYETAMEPRRDQSRRYVQLFKGQILPVSMYDSGAARDPYSDFDLVWNVIQAAANTAKSVVTRNRVRVTFQMEGADYELQEIVKAAELFVQGVWFGNRVYEDLDGQWFDDAATPGLGMLIVEPVNGDVVIERFIPDELIYNEVEAIRGKLRQAFRVQWLSPWEAISKHATTFDESGKAVVDKTKAAAIMSCRTTYNFPLHGVADAYIKLIPVYTGWFLPSRHGANDGVRVVGLPGISGPDALLSRRPYRWTKFPWACFRLERAPAGIWGIGIAERLSGFQYRLNELNYDIQEAARMAAVGKWMRETGSGVNPADLNNEHAGIIDYTNTAPQFVTLDAIPKDLIAERDATYEQAFRELGLSEWTVAGVQPNNIESGEGLQQLREQEQGRAVPAGQGWEGSHVELAELTVYAGCDAYEENKALKVKVVDPDGDGLTTVDFAKVAELLQDPDKWQVRPYPTSILPSSPTAKFEKLRQWKADGTIDQETFVALSEMPDTMQEASILLAGIKAVRWQIQQIVKRGAAGYEPPDPAMPLAYAVKIAHATYLKGLRTGMDDQRLSLLLSWLDDARALQAGAEAGAQAGISPASPTGPAPSQPSQEALPAAPAGLEAPSTANVPPEAAAVVGPEGLPPAAVGPVGGV